VAQTRRLAYLQLIDMSQTSSSAMDTKNVALVVPSSHYSVHEVLLPPTSKHRLQAALAGALEEHLLDDPADLHLAISPDAALAMKTKRPFAVLACDKVWLKTQCDKLLAAGQTIKAIVPEDPALQAVGWNLAQFEFRHQSRGSLHVKKGFQALWHAQEWQAARIALVALIAVQILGLNVWAWREREALADKRTQINQILLQTFPQTTAVIDASVQMQRAVDALKAKSGALSPNDFESQLVSKAVDANALQSIQFTNGALKVNP
jgi:general secretion pathway protein L